jgi:alkanesulfonate monooxygenase SsuD/methylene tetrahydromethanopterin reductase-like flavin-dependent oxidoreductase (luciferase family)
MDIGIGVPNMMAAGAPLIAGWAARAEQRGFSSLGTIDRIVYPSSDTMTALAVAAGATQRVGLISGILLAPLYPPVWLAKAAASLDAMSGGRLTLGLGVGMRPDDFTAMDRPLDKRGKLMDETLATMKTVFAGDLLPGLDQPVAPPGHPKLMIGGLADAAVRRVVEHGIGWFSGGGGPDMAAPMITKVRQAWSDAGREGSPRFAALVYFGLGDETQSRATLENYYAFNPGYASRVADSALRSPQAIKDALKAFEDAGVDELILDPTVADVTEVDRAADVVF